MHANIYSYTDYETVTNLNILKYKIFLFFLYVNMKITV